jgi:hypothetical protein
MRTKILTSALLYGLIPLSISPICGAQSNPVSRRTESPAIGQNLKLVSETPVNSEMAQTFAGPLRCDHDGNLYLMTKLDAVTGIRKLNPKGERSAVFVASSATDLQVQLAAYFSVAADGDVYQLAFLRDTIDRAVLTFKRDGTYKSSMRLNPGFIWTPSQVAAFSTGDVLVTGLKADRSLKVAVPFTGLFDKTGALRKQVVLADDKEIQDMAADGRVDSGHLYGNRAVEGGQMESADDGNIYLMRRLSSPIFYAISPSGEVAKRFIVDSGRSDFMPFSMHIAGKTIAILFHEPQTREEFVKVVDLSGKELATYEDPVVGGRGVLGPAFACYSDNPDRFTFLYTAEGGHLGFRIAEPR